MKWMLVLFVSVCVFVAHSADFISVSCSRPSAGKIRFNITWNAPPDFFTLDQYYRQADAFQLYIYPVYTNVIIGTVTWNEIPWTAIVRGVEAKSTSNIITVRTKTPAVKSPSYFRLKSVSHYNPPPNVPVTTSTYWLWSASGGWGDIIGTYPYSTNTGTNTIFEINTSTLGITNRFSMHVEAYKFGAAYRFIDQSVNIVP